MSVKVMAIGVHADDCEYGVGGTAKLLADAGATVRFVNTYPSKRLSSDPTFDLSAANEQTKRAATFLGADKIILGEDVRSRDYYAVTPENTALLEDAIHDFRPDIVFIQWPKDNHIEHQRVARASMDALFAAHVASTTPHEVYAYEAGPLQTMQYFYPDFFVNITNAAEAVRASLAAFDQPHANAGALWREKEVSARYRAHSAYAGYTFADAFKIIKFPDRGDDFLLRHLLPDSFKWCGNGMYPIGWRYFLDCQ